MMANVKLVVAGS